MFEGVVEDTRYLIERANGAGDAVGGGSLSLVHGEGKFIRWMAGAAAILQQAAGCGSG